MQKSITIDGDKLKEIAHRTATATVVATSLATRDRIRHESDIDRTRSQLVRDGEPIVETDYMEFWKNLEDTGVGSIIYANKRNGSKKPTRFKWHFSLKSIGKAMLEGGEIKFSGQAPPKVRAQEETPEHEFAQKTTFFLSANRVAEIRIPDNFTLKEAEAIYTALKTLAE